MGYLQLIVQSMLDTYISYRKSGTESDKQRHLLNASW